MWKEDVGGRNVLTSQNEALDKNDSPCTTGCEQRPEYILEKSARPSGGE